MTVLQMLSQVLGGVGLFLTGMVMTTDGLRAASGDSLRRVLLRFTGTPLQALVSGAAITALVQSSSATTVATISFVTAGLLTFQHALGVILGANIGTTATGWVVATVGLKFSVSTIALPLVGVGALIRLFARDRWQDIGMAIAGFGVLFVGLDVLQAGMAGASDYLTPETLPDDTWLGRLALVGIGAALTAVMQSSSAAIATTLAALHADAISMMQAAAMAIGVNVGTTVTAGLAAVGAGASARRTAVAHVLFNVLTGVVAFVSLPVLVAVISAFEDGDATLTLAAFHTAFNLLGILLVFPFIGRFTDFVERLIPDVGPRLTTRLEPRLASEGGLAIEAVRATTLDIARETVAVAESIVVERDLGHDVRELLEEVRTAVEFTHRFIESIRDLDNVGAQAQRRHVDVIHALDYLGQLVDMLHTDGVSLLREPPPLAGQTHEQTVAALEMMHRWLAAPHERPPAEQLGTLSRELAAERRRLRDLVLDETARGDYAAVDAARDIELVRRLDELVYHLWRFCVRLDHDTPRASG